MLVFSICTIVQQTPSKPYRDLIKHSPEIRLVHYGDDTEVKDNKLYCKYCFEQLPSGRISRIELHLASDKHKKNKEISTMYELLCTNPVRNSQLQLMIVDLLESLKSMRALQGDVATSNRPMSPYIVNRLLLVQSNLDMFAMTSPYFQQTYKVASVKLGTYMNQHPAMALFRDCTMFDPTQIGSGIGVKQFELYTAIRPWFSGQEVVAAQE